jgi:hypothetical protein
MAAAQKEHELNGVKSAKRKIQFEVDIFWQESFLPGRHTDTITHSYSIY